MESKGEITKELAVLYELALNIGKSQDMVKECESFLKILMSRKNLDGASVWIKADYEEEVRMFDAVPQTNMRDCYVSDETFKNMFFDRDYYSTAYPQMPFEGCVCTEHFDKGSFAIYRLKDMGFLILYSKHRETGFNLQEMNQLRDIVKKFANALEACRLYERIRDEIDVRIATENQLKQAMEKAEIANMTKSRFLATMSHEIRTPLNGVLGFINLLYTTNLDEEQKDYVDEAKNASDVLLLLINDVLDFSKIEAGKMKLEAIPFHLMMSIQSTVDMFRPTAEDKKIAITTQVDHGVPMYIVGDPIRLNQVLRNLMSNAVKFTPEGEIHVKVSCLQDLGDVHILQFEVRDTGIGIEEAKCHQMFEPFTQADSSTTRTHGGTGLGLAICRELVRMMDGTIDVESRPGEGALFKFTIQVGKTAQPAR